MIVINGSTATENDQRPRGHVALSEGWTPFDSTRWKKEDKEYRAAIHAGYISNPPTDLGRVYEEAPAAFVQRSGINTVYRAIRIRPQSKISAREPKKRQRIEVPPEGQLFPEKRDHMERMAAYQQLRQWPAEQPINSSDPDADLLPVQHVSGDDSAAQYISCSVEFDRSRRCSLTSYTLSGPKRQRRPYEWSPVIQIDLSRLPAECRVVDLCTYEARIRAGFFELDSRAATVGSLADSDREILLTGGIPGHAIVRVFDVVSVVREIKDDLYEEIVASDALRDFAAKERWRHLGALLKA
jgi:hypothetical protein